VIGGVVFQNEMQKQYPRLLSELGPDTAHLLTGGNAGASVGLVAKIPGHAGEVAREAYWNSLRTMYILYVAFAGLGLCLSFLITSRKLSKQHEEAKTGLKAMEEERAARKMERAASDEEKVTRRAEKKAGK
jgi:preprotein translocase subunit SecG